MIDEHVLPDIADYGVRPILFHIGEFGVPSYSFFLFLAVFVGILVYVNESRKAKKMNENTFIAVGALIGATLGAKIPIWIMNYDLIISNWGNWHYVLSGRTIVGGLIGGPIGVVLTKKWLGITSERRGNMFAPAIAIGDSIGRIGCFLRGCCGGKETMLPWGVDFGDGVMRHPTQIYESIFALIMFIYIMYLKKNKKNLKDGELFILFMNCYFIYRFLIEFIRVEKVVFLGLTVFQLAALGVLIYLNRFWIKDTFFQVKKLKTRE